MPLAFGYQGQYYDDSIPLYVEMGHNRVINRLTHQILDAAALQAQMVAESYTPPDGEIEGAYSWGINNTGPWNNWASQAPDIVQATGLPITGNVGGTVTTTIGLEFHGVKLNVAMTATVTYNIGATDATATAALTVGMTPDQQTEAIKVAINAVVGLGATRSGTTIVVIPDNTIVLSKLVLAIA